MINFRLAILNPWHNEKKNPFKTIIQRTWIVFTHKELELGLFYYPYYWFEFVINTQFCGEDHAGPEWVAHHIRQKPDYHPRGQQIDAR